MSVYNIYVLENEDKRIKIGITTNFENRKKSLSGSNGGGSKIVREYVSLDTHLQSLERVMHTHFAKYRIPGTEWFKDVTFEEVVSKLVELTSSDEYHRCNEIRKQYASVLESKELTQEV